MTPAGAEPAALGRSAVAVAEPSTEPRVQRGPCEGLRAAFGQAETETSASFLLPGLCGGVLLPRG